MSKIALAEAIFSSPCCTFLLFIGGGIWSSCVRIGDSLLEHDAPSKSTTKNTAPKAFTWKNGNGSVLTYETQKSPLNFGGPFYFSKNDQI